MKTIAVLFGVLLWSGGLMLGVDDAKASPLCTDLLDKHKSICTPYNDEYYTDEQRKICTRPGGASG